MKAIRLSALGSGRLYPSLNILGVHFCYRLIRPQGHSVARRIMPIKISNETIRNRTRAFPAFGAVLQPSALRRDYLHKRERNFFSLYNRNIHHRVHSGLSLAYVFLSISADHNLTSQNFKIHINTIVLFTYFSSKWCLRFRNSG